MANFTIPYTTPGNYTYDNTKIEVDSGLAKLKNLVPTDETFYASYNININGSRGLGVLTGTAYGGASVSGGKLDLAHNDTRYVDYDADLNADSQQTGCIRFKVTPNYSGNPATSQWFFAICKQNNKLNNLIQLRHSPSGGYLRLHVYDKDGIFVGEHLCGQFLPTADTEYEIELNWDFTTGATRVFINGVQNGSTFTSTFFRDSDIGLFRIGNDFNLGSTSNFKIDDFQVFSTVQHTANYTPEVIPETTYATDSPTIYKTTGDSIANIEVWVNFIEALGSGNEGTVQYQLSEDAITWQYWNGSVWATAGASDYNLVGTISANISTFSAIEDKIYLKAFLISNGDQKVELDLNEIGYIINTAPTVYAGTDKIAIYNTALLVFSDCIFSDAEGNIVKAEWKEEGGSYTEIPQGAYSTLLEAVQAFEYTPTYSGNKAIYLKITDSYDDSSEDTLIVNVNRVNVTVNIKNSDGYDLGEVTFTPGDGGATTSRNSPFIYTYLIGTYTATCSKTGFDNLSQSVTIDISVSSLTFTMTEKTPISDLNISVDFPYQVFIGDSINIPCQVDGDLTGYGIRCEIYDESCNEIKLANATAGGSESEIADTVLTNGKFLIQVADGLTDDFGRVLEQYYSQTIKVWCEIELEDTDGHKYTIYKKPFKMIQQGLDWESSS